MSKPSRVTVAVALLAGTAGVFAQTTWSVPDDVPTIQAAIDVAASFDRVEVAPGTYFEALVLDDKAIEIIGTAGADATIIDATGMATSTILVDGTGTARLALEGVTLRGGVGSTSPHGPFDFLLGGGLHVRAGGARLFDCIVRDCSADRGGGVYASPLTFMVPPAELEMNGGALTGNAATFGGGAHGDVVLNEVDVCGNTAEQGGGLADVTLAQACLIEGNTATLGGGAYHRVTYTTTTQIDMLVDCEVRDNVATEQGGGLYVWGFDLGIFGSLPVTAGTGNLFVGNTAGDSGGGAYLRTFADGDFNSPASITVAACRFVDNEAPTGDGLDAYLEELGFGTTSGVTVRNCTFVGDSLRILDEADTHLFVTSLVNTIVRSPPEPPQVLDTSPGGPRVEYNDIEGGVSGLGNIDADPLFTDLAALDLSLQPGSPCINTGDPALLDPDGSPSDMGAIAFHPWTDLGLGLAGSTTPALDGTGPLTGDAPGSLELVDAPPGAATFLVLGLSQILAPFKLGVLVPAPDVILGPLPADPGGAISIPFVWPAGFPSGLETVWQVWLPMGGGPIGWSASNGLLATTP